ncbi:CRISPR-associated endonuclease Cas1 [Scytonema sp. UIC 10036]|nr:CRISPR-associated endonuclease Cas1 [Scytonema sp. UIC 10036]
MAFNGRNRNPPDPVNALLSFSYALLKTQVTAAFI